MTDKNCVSGQFRIVVFLRRFLDAILTFVEILEEVPYCINADISAPIVYDRVGIVRVVIVSSSLHLLHICNILPIYALKEWAGDDHFL